MRFWFRSRTNRRLDSIDKRLDNTDHTLGIMSGALGSISRSLDEMATEILKLRNELVVTFSGELDPKRKAMSDELGRRMEQKLIAEDKARRHTLGEL